MDIYFWRVFTHYFLHLVFPFFIAYIFFRKEWRKAYFILLCTMAVDLDHLLSTPVFSPDRCSINHHLLHQYWAIFIYAGMLFLRGNFRIIAVGLLLHMFTDWQDYYLWVKHLI